jgi:hypothetical protein
VTRREFNKHVGCAVGPSCLQARHEISESSDLPLACGDGSESVLSLAHHPCRATIPIDSTKTLTGNQFLDLSFNAT